MIDCGLENLKRYHEGTFKDIYNIITDGELTKQHSTDGCFKMNEK